MTSHKPNNLPKAHLLILSHWGLGLQQTKLREKQAFSLQQLQRTEFIFLTVSRHARGVRGDPHLPPAKPGVEAEHWLYTGSVFRGLVCQQPFGVCAKRGKWTLIQVDGEDSAYVSSQMPSFFSFNDEYNERKRSHEILDTV